MSKMHFIQMTLVIVMISLTGARVGTKPKSMPVARSDTLGIVMVGWISVRTYTYQRLIADGTMAGDKNVGGALIPTHNNSHCQVSALAKSQGVPDSQYHGDRFLVCSCYNHFHGNLTILSKHVLWSELVGRLGRHHFNVSVATFRYGFIHVHSSSTLEISFADISSRREGHSPSGLRSSLSTCGGSQNNLGDPRR